MSASDRAALKSSLQDLGRLIHGCHHGGPSKSEQGCVWFQESVRLSTWDPTPIDLLFGSSSMFGDDEIKRALIAVINVIIDSQRGFHVCLGNIGSRKFFAAMAVDAWFNEDYAMVRKFLTKSIILYHLQKSGSKTTLQEIGGNHQSRTSLLEQVKGIMSCHNQGLKQYLEFCTDGSCTCIGLAQTLNNEKDIIMNLDADKKTTDELKKQKKQREGEQLPPVLKPTSKYWKLKMKAAECLQKKKLEYATKLYLKAKDMLEEHADPVGAPLHQKEWQLKIGEEIGKIASNLSMICLMTDEKEKALEYADEAVQKCPGWSKTYCRRALALKSLGRLEEARISIFNAIKRTDKFTTAEKKQLKEYQNIKKEIEAELGERNDMRSAYLKNSLYKPLDLKPGGNNDGNTICSIRDNQDVMDLVYGFLVPLDVANLERTCLKFAIDAERGRRISIACKLIPTKEMSSLPSSSPGDNEVTTEHFFVKYINSVDDSPKKALRAFASDVSHFISDDVWEDYLDTIQIDPESLETLLAPWFSIILRSNARKLFDMLNPDFETSLDFVIVKYIFQSEIESCGELKHVILHSMSGLADDEDSNGFLRRCIRHSLDIEIMRLAVSLENNNGHFESELRSTAFIVLNNCILTKASLKRKQMNPDHPVMRHTLTGNALYTESVPNEWPGEFDDDSFSRGVGSLKKETIGRYLMDSEKCQMWEVALTEMLKWARDVEKGEHIIDYILVGRLFFGQIMSSEHSPISFVSFGAFVLMKAAECGSVVALSMRLKSRDDLTDFFYQFYDFLRVFSAGFPALVEHTENIVAQHYSFMD